MGNLTRERTDKSMKRFPQCLALLLAVLLLPASFTACDSEALPADGTADAATTLADPEPEVPESKLLTPSQFFEVLRSDEDMTVVEKWGSDEEETVAVYTRDASKAKRSVDSSDRYYDLAQKREYSYIDDQWLESELTVFEAWEGLVDFWIWSEDDADPLAIDGNYAKTDGRYVMTDEGIELYFAEQRKALDEFDRIYGENPMFEAYCGYEDGAHVFGYRLESEDGRFVSCYSVAVTVADMTVTLPDTSN